MFANSTTSLEYLKESSNLYLQTVKVHVLDWMMSSSDQDMTLYMKGGKGQAVEHMEAIYKVREWLAEAGGKFYLLDALNLLPLSCPFCSIRSTSTIFIEVG